MYVASVYYLIPFTALNFPSKNDFQFLHAHCGKRTATFVFDDLFTTFSSCPSVSTSVRLYTRLMWAKPESTKHRACPVRIKQG
jgi:hypothetical protein